jgi:hypothetical protein
MSEHQPRASRHGRKLTLDDVEAILHRLKEEAPEAIAKDYGISRIMVYYIETGQKWKRLTRKQFVPFEGGSMEVSITYDPRQVKEETLKRVKSVLDQAEQLGALLKDGD